MNDTLNNTSVRLVLTLGALLIGWLVVLIALNALIIAALIAMFPPVNEGRWSLPVGIIGLLSVLGSVVLFALGIAAVMEVASKEL